MLGEALGARVSFVPFDAEASIAFDFQDLPVNRVVELLSQYGVVTVGEKRSSKAAAAGAVDDRVITFRAEKLDAAQLSKALSRALGQEVAFRTTPADEQFSIDVQDAPVHRVLGLLARYGELLVGGKTVERPEQ